MQDGRSPISTREKRSNPEGNVENRPEFAVTCAAVVFACCHGIFGLFVAVVAHVGDPTVGMVCAGIGGFVVLLTYKFSRLLHSILRIVALLITSVIALVANVMMAEWLI
jgi:hypothetical protein